MKSYFSSIQVIKNDFELIRLLYSDAKSLGFNTLIGYCSIIILLSQFYNIGYITSGDIMEDLFLNNGAKFVNIIIHFKFIKNRYLCI